MWKVELVSRGPAPRLVFLSWHINKVSIYLSIYTRDKLKKPTFTRSQRDGKLTLFRWFEFRLHSTCFFLIKCLILLNRTHFRQIIICLTWMKSFFFLCWSWKPTTNSTEWNFVNSFLEVNLDDWQLTPESIISTIKLRNS